MGHRAVIYSRVSTADQSCERQECELLKFADRGEYHVLETFRETQSGAKDNRRQRNKAIALAQSRKIDVILVFELGPFNHRSFKYT